MADNDGGLEGLKAEESWTLDDQKHFGQWVDREGRAAVMAATQRYLAKGGTAKMTSVRMMKVNASRWVSALLKDDELSDHYKEKVASLGPLRRLAMCHACVGLCRQAQIQKLREEELKERIAAGIYYLTDDDELSDYSSEDDIDDEEDEDDHGDAAVAMTGTETQEQEDDASGSDAGQVIGSENDTQEQEGYEVETSTDQGNDSEDAAEIEPEWWEEFERQFIDIQDQNQEHEGNEGETAEGQGDDIEDVDMGEPDWWNEFAPEVDYNSAFYSLAL